MQNLIPFYQDVQDKIISKQIIDKLHIVLAKIDTPDVLETYKRNNVLALNLSKGWLISQMKNNSILTMQELSKEKLTEPLKLQEVHTCIHLGISLALQFLETEITLFSVEGKDTKFKELINYFIQLIQFFKSNVSVEQIQNATDFPLQQRVLVYSFLICQISCLYNDVVDYRQSKLQQTALIQQQLNSISSKPIQVPETITQQGAQAVPELQSHNQQTQQFTVHSQIEPHSSATHDDQALSLTTQASLQQQSDQQASKQLLEGQLTSVQEEDEKQTDLSQHKKVEYSLGFQSKKYSAPYFILQNHFLLETFDRNYNPYLQKSINLLENIVNSSNPNHALLAAMHYLDKDYDYLQNNTQNFDVQGELNEMQQKSEISYELLRVHLRDLVPKRMCSINFRQNYDQVSKDPDFLNSPIAKTLLDGSLYLRADILNGLKANYNNQEKTDDVKTATLFLAILHEMGHLKQLTYAQNFNYLLQSPEKNIEQESGLFLEKTIFNGLIVTDLLSFMDDTAAKIILDMQNWQQEKSQILVGGLERLRDFANQQKQNKSVKTGHKNLAGDYINDASYDSPGKGSGESDQPWWLRNNFKRELTNEEIMDYILNYEMGCDGRLLSNREWRMKKYGHCKRFH